MTDNIALLDEPATLRPNSVMREFGRRPTLGELQRAIAGCACDVSAASITRRWLARSPLSCGGRRHQVTNCVPAPAAPVAAGKVRPSSGQAGPVIILASVRFRLKSPTRCATMILLAHSDSRVHPRAAVWVPHRLSLRPIAIWRGRYIPPAAVRSNAGR